MRIRQSWTPVLANQLSIESQLVGKRLNRGLGGCYQTLDLARGRFLEFTKKKTADLDGERRAARPLFGDCLSSPNLAADFPD
jgi:hypothetical protein